jgi:hypothetical protein
MKYIVLTTVLVFSTPIHAQVYNPSWNGFETPNTMKESLDALTRELKRSNDIIEYPPIVVPPPLKYCLTESKLSCNY